MNVSQITYWSIFVGGTVAVYCAASLARPWFHACFAPGAPAPAAVKPAVAAAASPAAGASEDDFNAPALNGIFPAGMRGEATWGVTIKPVSFYTLVGANQGTLPGGVLFICEGERKSSRGAMLTCRRLVAGKAEGDPFLVRRRDVMALTGLHTALTSRQLQALGRYYVLEDAAEARKQVIIRENADCNPFVQAGRRALAAYQKNEAAMRKLADSRETTVAAARVALDDQLRQLKFEESKAKSELDAAQKQIEEWKKTNPSRVRDPEQDRRVLELRAEQKTLEPMIPGLFF